MDPVIRLVHCSATGDSAGLEMALLERALADSGLLFTRTGPGAQCFYRLLLQPTLFGEIDLVREWGRLSQENAPRRLIHHYGCAADLIAPLIRTIRVRLRHGYRSHALPGRFIPWATSVAWCPVPSLGQRSGGRDPARLRHQLVVVGHGLGVGALPGPADDPRRIDDEDRALGHSSVAGDVVAAHAEGLHRPPLEIGQQREGQASQLLDEGVVGEDRVHTDGVDADIGLGQLLVPGPQLGQLGLSTRGEVEDVESKHRGPVATEGFRELDVLSTGAGELQIGGGITGV
jgi:hypothetical protein